MSKAEVGYSRERRHNLKPFSFRAATFTTFDLWSDDRNLFFSQREAGWWKLLTQGRQPAHIPQCVITSRESDANIQKANVPSKER